MRFLPSKHRFERPRLKAVAIILASMCSCAPSRAGSDGELERPRAAAAEQEAEQEAEPKAEPKAKQEAKQEAEQEAKQETEPEAKAAADEATPGNPADFLKLVLRSPLERAGDYDGLVTAWLEAIAEWGDDFRCELLLRRLESFGPYLRDPAAVLPHVERAAAATYRSGVTPHLLRRLLASSYRRLGRTAELEALDLEREYLLHWCAIGPFGKADAMPFLQTYPPETQLRFDSTFRDGWQELRWRKVERKLPGATVRPFDFTHPQRGVVYLLSQVEAREPQDVTLHYGTSGSIEIWLNGVQVVDDDFTERYLARRRRVAVRLAGGWNRVLVKTRNPFAIRITEHHDRPADLAQEEAFRLHPLPQSIPDPRTPSMTSSDVLTRWTAWLQEELNGETSPDTDGGPLRATAYSGLGYLYRAYGRMDLAVDAANQALQLTADDPYVAYHAATMFQGASHLPAGVARNRARDSLERALERDADFVPAYEGLGRLLLSDEQHARAASKIREGLARGKSVPGLLTLKSVFAKAGWYEEEVATVAEIARLAPGSTVPEAFWSTHYRERGNHAKAISFLRQAHEKNPGVSRHLSGLARLHEECGEVKDAIAAAEKRLRLAPDHPAAQDETVDTLVAGGELDRALEVLAEASQQNPLDPAFEVRMGEIHEQRGERELALTRYRKALELDPGDIRLRRYVAKLDGETEPFWQKYDEKLEDWISLVPSEGALVEKASSVAVLDISVVEVHADGSFSEYVHQALKLLSEESKDKLAEVRTRGDVVALRTLTPDGTVLEPVAAQGAGSYVMPGLVPGAFIEYAYRVDESGRRGQRLRRGGFYFQDPRFEQAFLLSRYVIILPPGGDHGFLEHNLDAASTDGTLARVERRRVELADGRVARIYEAQRAPRIERERFMPPAQEYVPNVEVVEKQSWNEVASELRGALAGMTRPTPELQAVARQVTDGIVSPLERARALYGHVNDLITKQGPARGATQILLEKSGSRNVLFKALLDLADVPNAWAFLRPSEELMPRANWAYPHRDLFLLRGQYIFVVIEGDVGTPDPEADLPHQLPERTYVSLTQRRTPFGRLPEALAGGKALILTPRGHKLLSLPGGSPRAHATSIRGTIQLGGALDCDIAVLVEDRRFFAMAQKDRFRTIQGFQKGMVLQSLANRYVPGARLKRGDFLGLDDAAAPFTIDLEIAAPSMLQESGAQSLLRPLFQPLQLVRSYSGRAERQHPFQLSNQHVVSDSLRVRPGDSYLLVTRPMDVALSSALGTYSLVYRQDGDDIIVEREMTLRPGRVSAEDFATFVQFCEAADAAESESLVFRKR